jgi:hypothetical protein
MTVDTTYIPVTLTTFTHPERLPEPYTISTFVHSITDPAVISQDCPPYTGRTVSELPGDSHVSQTSSSSKPTGTSQTPTPASNAPQPTGRPSNASTPTNSGTPSQERLWNAIVVPFILFSTFLSIV